MGFVADRRRLNVALTRARRAIVVVGDDQTLRSSTHWRSYLEWLHDHGCFLDAETCAMLRGETGRSEPSQGDGGARDSSENEKRREEQEEVIRRFVEEQSEQ